MANLPADRETGDDPGVGSDRGSTPGTPLWVKVFGLIALIVVVLFVVVLLVVGGEHGPGRHTSGGASNTTPEGSRGHSGPLSGFEHGDQQP